MVTRDNYFSAENNLHYMGSTQFKDFAKCEAAALARIRLEWYEEPNKAMLIGSYIDAHFEGSLDDFKANHPEIFKRDGSLLADFSQANSIFKRVERDEMFMRYMAGEKQVIKTGYIEGVPVKIRIDSYFSGRAIVDLKVMKDFNRIWNEELRCKESFVEAWGYDLQGAIYQRIEGNFLPFFIAGVTKENEPDLAIIAIPQNSLDAAMTIVEAHIGRYNDIKQGRIEPTRCEHCDYCRSTKVLTKIIDFTEAGL